MTITRKLSLTTALLAVAGSGVAAAAEAPVVSAQKTSASRYSPVQIPGTGIKKGELLPKGSKLIYRDATIGPDQEVKFSLRAPEGKTIRALADRGVTFNARVQILNREIYGRRHVYYRAYAHDLDHRATMRMYALVR